MFFTVEALLRRPIPLRVREIAHLLGLLVIVTLMAVAFKNDVEKRWDVIRGHVRELVL
jgi:regulator of sigma E protease